MAKKNPDHVRTVLALPKTTAEQKLVLIAFTRAGLDAELSLDQLQDALNIPRINDLDRAIRALHGHDKLNKAGRNVWKLAPSLKAYLASDGAAQTAAPPKPRAKPAAVVEEEPKLETVVAKVKKKLASKPKKGAGDA